MLPQIFNLRKQCTKKGFITQEQIHFLAGCNADELDAFQIKEDHSEENEKNQGAAPDFKPINLSFGLIRQPV
jgi:hypothetical protein